MNSYAPIETGLPLVAADGLCYSLPDGTELLQDLSLRIGHEKVGLIGPNGVGKSSLLRLLNGEFEPTAGKVRHSGRWGYLPQEVAADEARSVAQALGIQARLAALARIEAGACDTADFDLVGEDGWTLADRAAATLASLGLAHIGLERSLASLSGGERTRVALGALLLDAPDLLLLDEPTNHLDAATRDTLYRSIEAWSGAMLVVTHDRGLLRRVDRILRLSRSGLDSYGGNYDDYLALSAAEEDAANRRLKDAERELGKVRRQLQESREKHQNREAAGRRGRSTGSQSKLFYNAQRERSTRSSAGLAVQTERMLDAAQQRLQSSRAAVEEYERISVPRNAAAAAQGKIALALEEVSYTPPGADRPLFDNLNLRLLGTERVALGGANGTGKTTLLRIVQGELAPTGGRVVRGVKHIAYLEQIGSSLHAGDTVLESFLRANPAVSEGDARQRLAHFLFFGDEVFKRIGALSGGERVRVGLVRVLLGDPAPSLLLLDEPTNHLDLDAIVSIENALRSYTGALLVVSHSPDFLRNVGVDREFSMPERA
ncbi:ATPase components of ABC transporters with duplicated ATPase domains [Lysobacter sp. yr284]|uniref:ABC-F family ATP-binding cassette domain-containing protein n=1 Tax=Lysobacter sp. yr284 TaxID=1761791 RepID=UPI0008973161|nr:ABC-F family ATP-binding cassette domain-containing protein [Lysobacter sp. yr284]SDY35874.1 ATPase components of ABC transporters with duplicated ATPase domains [Lysobacter sp. yr284]